LPAPEGYIYKEDDKGNIGLQMDPAFWASRVNPGEGLNLDSRGIPYGSPE
jgi:hypothetical protein